MTKKYIELILNNKIEHLGNSGTIIKVAIGYARNYLLPTKQASIMTKNKLKQIEVLQTKKMLLKHTQEKKFILLKSLLEKVNKFTLIRKSNVTGQIFGSVADKDITQIIFDITGQNIDKNYIILPEVKFIGNYIVSIILTETIQANIQLRVLPDIKN